MKNNAKRLAKNKAARISHKRKIMKARRARRTSKHNQDDAWENWAAENGEGDWTDYGDEAGWAWDGDWYPMEPGSTKSSKRAKGTQKVDQDAQDGAVDTGGSKAGKTEPAYEDNRRHGRPAG